MLCLGFANGDNVGHTIRTCVIAAIVGWLLHGGQVTEQFGVPALVALAIPGLAAGLKGALTKKKD